MVFLEDYFNAPTDLEQLAKDLEIINKSDAFDAPTPQDYKLSDLEEWWSIDSDLGWAIQTELPTDKLVIFDQSEDARTANGCTIYSPMIGNNLQNIIEYQTKNLWEYPQNNPKPYWLDYRRYWNLYTGWSMQAWLEYIRKRWFISGRAVALTTAELDYSLSKKRFIVTWTSRCDRAKTFQTKKFTPSGNNIGHIFTIILKMGLFYVCTHWYKSCPYFLIHRDHLQYLFSRNALLDTECVDPLRLLKAKQIALWVTKWNSDLWNATDNEDLKKRLAELNPIIKKIYNI